MSISEQKRLTENERERYLRQIPLAGVGEVGQRKLLAAKVLIIGAGGLGSPAAMYLAAAGVGEIGIVDDDRVDLSNLQRQIAYQTADIGKNKVSSLAATLIACNPAVRLNAYNVRIGADNIESILSDRNYNFVLDCTDNFPTKFLINDTCVRLQKPFSYAGITGFYGQIMTVVAGKGPCYRCIFEDVPKEGDAAKSHEVGVLGAAVGVMGSLQAVEAIKYIVGIGDLLVGRMLLYDAKKQTFRTLHLGKCSKHCAVCANKQ